jgi:hypothetical protein
MWPKWKKLENLGFQDSKLQTPDSDQYPIGVAQQTAYNNL